MLSRDVEPGCVVFDSDIIPIAPYFIVKKNRHGWQDENIHIPLELLSKFLQNPRGKLDWININKKKA